MATVTLPGEEDLLLRVDRKTQNLQVRHYELFFTKGSKAGAEVQLNGPTVLGSQTPADVVIDDPAVSRAHVRLTPRADGLRVEDLQSKNGVRVGGLKVQDALIRQSAVVGIGQTEFRVEVKDLGAGHAAPRATFPGLVGESPAMRQLFGTLDRVAVTDSPVLLLGETGTGKEMISRAIHQRSRRSGAHFVVADCAAIQPTLFESELFGHKEGSFTGAVADREGAFARAHGGTLFLDEVGELPLPLQPKLLRVLETRKVTPVGGDAPEPCEFRLVAATHRDLPRMVKEGTFREDLFFRLEVVVLDVPPLRERTQDIPALIAHFSSELGASPLSIPPEVAAQLAHHRWPGNLRELKNLVERWVSLGQVTGPRGDALGETPSSDAAFKDAKERVLDAFTAEYLADLFKKCGGNVSEMSRVAGINRNHVQKLLRKHGLK